jgi:hypothetical protein
MELLTDVGGIGGIMKRSYLAFAIVALAFVLVPFQNCSQQAFKSAGFDSALNSLSITENSSTGNEPANSDVSSQEVLKVTLIDDSMNAQMNANEVPMNLEIKMPTETVDVQSNDGQRRTFKIPLDHVRQLHLLIAQLKRQAQQRRWCLVDASNSMNSTSSSTKVAIELKSTIPVAEPKIDIGRLPCVGGVDTLTAELQEIIVLIKRLLSEREICQNIEAPQPQCAAGSRLFERRIGQCVVGIKCLPPEVPICPAIAVLPPVCAAGEKPFEEKNASGCTTGFKCQRVVCPIIAQGIPSCAKGESMQTVRDEDNCPVGYKCAPTITNPLPPAPIKPPPIPQPVPLPIPVPEPMPAPEPPPQPAPPVLPIDPPEIDPPVGIKPRICPLYLEIAAPDCDDNQVLTSIVTNPGERCPIRKWICAENAKSGEIQPRLSEQ